jgi:hypothetical protein
MEKYCYRIKIELRAWRIVVPIKLYNIFVTLPIEMAQPYVNNLTDEVIKVICAPR